MRVTEEQAKTMHCPLARWSGEDGASVNRWAFREGPEYFARCLGSRCMAWQHGLLPDRRRVFAEVETARKAEDAGAEPVVEGVEFEFLPYDKYGEGDPAMWIETEASAETRRKGFCGALEPR